MEAGLDSVAYWETVAERRLGRYVTGLEQEMLERALRLLPGTGTALEIGCGGGRWARIPAARGWGMVCTDVDAHSVAVCQQRLPAARCVQVGAAEPQFPCAPGAVDLVICFEVEPVTESPWFAGEAFRVLRPGGILVTSFLNRRSLRGVLHKLLRRSAGASRFYRHSYASKRQGLHAAGFALVEERGCCWVPFSRASNTCLVPVCAQLEGWLGLRQLPSLSPWVLVLARKPSPADPVPAACQGR